MVRDYLVNKKNEKMNKSLMIFESEEFGEIRTVVINNKPYFVGKDVAERLGYSNTNDDIKRHCKGIVKHEGLKINGIEVALIPESDLYRLIIKSKLKEAEKFECWVMEEVLPAIRMTGQYSKKMSDEDIVIYQLEEQKKIKQQLNEINNRTLRVEHQINNLHLLAADSSELTAVAKRKVVALLGGKGAPAYKMFNRKAFSDLYHELHRQFDVNKICAIKRKDLEDAKSIILNYMLLMKLKNDVEVANNQMAINV